MNAETIQQMIESGLPGSRAMVSGDDGSHFDAVIVSEAFAGKSPVQQQQLVYATLGDHITNGAIHALSMRCYTPEQWEAAGQPG